MNDLTSENGTPRDTSPARFKPDCFHMSMQFGRNPVTRRMLIVRTSKAMSGRHISIAQPSGRFHQRVEHGLQIEGRTADDLEHVGGGGLLLQRFAQLGGALLHVVEQPHVLDRNHRLVGESGQQFDLTLGVRPDRSPSQRQHPDRRALAHQRHAKHGVKLAGLPHLGQHVFGISCGIEDMNGFPRQQYAPNQTSAFRLEPQLFQVIPVPT